MKGVLVPLDFSPCSLAAMEYAAMIARTLDVPITLLHVYEPPAAMENIVPAADESTDLEAERAAASRKLQEVAREAKCLVGLVVELTVEAGYPTSAILDQSRAADCNLIVMGTHGRSGVTKFLMGSVTQHVLRHAVCPVISVHVPSDGSTAHESAT